LHALLFLVRLLSPFFNTLAWPQVTVITLMIHLPIIIAEWVTARAPRDYLRPRTPRRRDR
jgi:hypothetical protein